MMRKDYILISAHLRTVAAQINNHTAEPTNAMRMAVWQECVNAVARALAHDNPAFNHGKFLAACSTSRKYNEDQLKWDIVTYHAGDNGNFEGK